jgi:predicted small lipoprotein YifL
MSKILSIVFIALTLAACGVRGDPQPPAQLQQSQ